ncbi:MAG: hypothetical protein Q8O13_00535 [Candidatus Omnitrophota bacterium]|nr:hypothetical protein [Candidatus Omnitrophota bacterium]
MTETTQETKTDSGKKILATALKVILGIVLIVLGLALVIRWWEALFTVIRGCLGLFLILAGLITLAIAKE